MQSAMGPTMMGLTSGRSALKADTNTVLTLTAHPKS